MPPAPTACDVLASRTDAVYAAMPSRDGCAPTKIDSLACERVGSATWGFVVERASLNADCDTALRVKLVRVDADAGETSGAPFDATEAWHSKNRFTIRELGDYDGDGSPEILVEHSVDVHSVGGRARATLWTLRAARIERYAPAAKIEIAGAEDVDGDGRIDLLTRGPYGAVAADESYMDPQIAPALFVAHAMPDGTFLEGDSVARTYARDKCRLAARSIVGSREAANEDALAIVCARLHGVTLAADASSSWRTRLAAVAPPFVLDSDGG